MKQYILLILIVLMPLFLKAQKDTIMYFSKTGGVIPSSEGANYYVKVQKVKDNKFNLVYYEKSANNSWTEYANDKITQINDTSYLVKINEKGINYKTIRVFHQVDTGYLIKHYVNNQLVSEGFSKFIFPLILEGEWTFYNDNGSIYRSEFYYNNQQIVNEDVYSSNDTINNINREDTTNNINENETSSEQPFTIVERMPDFPSGYDGMMRFIKMNLKYPVEAAKNGITGTVYVRFVIKKDGTVSDVSILRGVHPLLDNEAMRVVRMMPKWKPGMQNGKPVPVYFTIPVKFIL